MLSGRGHLKQDFDLNQVVSINVPIGYNEGRQLELEFVQKEPVVYVRRAPFAVGLVKAESRVAESRVAESREVEVRNQPLVDSDCMVVVFRKTFSLKN